MNKSLNTAAQVEKLKSSLAKKLSAEYPDAGMGLIHRAVNEASALASVTSVPLLLLPALAEEKVQKAVAWPAYQRRPFHFASSFAFGG
jgi:hypothetical protein